MSSVRALNPKAEVLGSQAALFMNINAAKGLHDVMKTNLGPKGTIKMLVGGAGDIKLTKDGNVLLRDMQIQNPTAVLIARAAVAQDDVTGDGTTSTVVLIGDLMRQAERHVADGLHPRVLADGFDAARDVCLKVLEDMAVPIDRADRATLLAVARSSVRTKLRPELADSLAEIVADAVLLIQGGDAKRSAARGDEREEEEGENKGAAEAAGSAPQGAKEGIPDETKTKSSSSSLAASSIDLHMVELLSMRHRLDTETRLVRGLVLDHGARHPDMPKDVSDAYILNLNLSLEYERAEAAAGFYYSSADQREALARAERAVVDDKVRRVVELRERITKEYQDAWLRKQEQAKADAAAEDGAASPAPVAPAPPVPGFVVINQKGIDPESLDLLAKAGILALRRAKRRNAERLALACGGHVVNALEDLDPSALGFAGRVREHALGEDRFTFVEDVRHPKSCTILIKAPTDYGIAQIKDAVRDGLRAVKNAVEDGRVVPGAGAFEVKAAIALRDLAAQSRKQAKAQGNDADAPAKAPVVQGRARLGVEAFAEALLAAPRILAENAGLDGQEAVVSLLEAQRDAPDAPVGVDLASGEPIDPTLEGIYDTLLVKRQIVQSAPVVASQLLLVDEVLRAGINMRKR